MEKTRPPILGTGELKSLIGLIGDGFIMIVGRMFSNLHASLRKGIEGLLAFGGKIELMRYWSIDRPRARL